MRITKYRTELGKRKENILIKESSSNYQIDSMNTPEKIARMLVDLYGLDRRAEEYLYLIAVDAKMHPVGVFEVSHGLANGTFCNPREIFIRALLCGAFGIVIAHNHPSGNVEPSDDDVRSAKRVKEAAALLGVEFMDSIIIGESGSYASLVELSRL